MAKSQLSIEFDGAGVIASSVSASGQVFVWEVNANLEGAADAGPAALRYPPGLLRGVEYWSGGDLG